MKNAAILIGILLIAGVSITVFAQNRLHDQIMKDVNGTFAALRKDIDSSSAAAVQQDAAKLSALFREVEGFWQPLRSKSALQAAKSLQSVADEIAGAAKANDLKRAETLYSGIGKTCKGCHDRHRFQMPDKTFKIRP